MKQLRVYADTSVYGGCFDKEFDTDSRQFFRDVEGGTYLLLTSSAIDTELVGAPANVKAIVRSLPDDCIEELPITQEVLDLREAYLKSEIVTRKSVNDASHVAIATVGGADILLSWNFDHLVNLRRRLGFNSVNMANGYRVVHIVSPKELRTNESEEEEI